MTKGRVEKKTFLEQSEGFLASFNQVLAQGFFSDLRAEINTLEGNGATMITIWAQAYIPDNKKRMPHGITPYFDSGAMLASVREQLIGNKFVISSFRCEVKTGVWPKLDKAGEKAIGKRGLNLVFDFSLFLQPKSWVEKD